MSFSRVLKTIYDTFLWLVLAFCLLYWGILGLLFGSAFLSHGLTGVEGLANHLSRSISATATDGPDGTLEISVGPTVPFFWFPMVLAIITGITTVLGRRQFGKTLKEISALFKKG